MGDGVNIAARLQEIALPSSICISEIVHTQATASSRLASTPGPAEAEEHSDPIRVYRIAGVPASRAEATPMKHAGPAALARIAPLLEELRARPVLRESRPGVFELKSRAFLHFHDDPSGVFADVRLGEDFVRLPVTSPSEQSDLLERIDECLSGIESRATDRRRGRQTGRSRGR